MNGFLHDGDNVIDTLQEEHEHGLAARVREIEADLAAYVARENQVTAIYNALQLLVEDGECYCADNVAVKGPCGHCIARRALKGGAA